MRLLLSIIQNLLHYRFLFVIFMSSFPSYLLNAGNLHDILITVDNQSAMPVYFQSDSPTTQNDSNGIFFSTRPNIKRSFAIQFLNGLSLDRLYYSLNKNSASSAESLVLINNAPNPDDHEDQEYFIQISSQQKITSLSSQDKIEVYGESDRQLTHTLHVVNQTTHPVYVEIPEPANSSIALRLQGHVAENDAFPTGTIETNDVANIKSLIVNSPSLKHPISLDLSSIYSSNDASLFFYSKFNVDDKKYPEEDIPFLRIEVIKWGIEKREDAPINEKIFAYEYNVIIQDVTQKFIDDQKNASLNSTIVF